VERGVVVGGLMICGSFLLAALLNRSAMDEVPAPIPAVPVDVTAPAVSPMIDPAAVIPKSAPDPIRCTDPDTSADAEAPTNDDTDRRADLMVNGRESCVP
jgi:hypothetical protein